MARNKESLVVVLDVSPSPFPFLNAARKAVELLIERKLLYRPNDEFALVLMGTEETDNAVNLEFGGYDYILTAFQMQTVSASMLGQIRSIQGGSRPGDFVDSLVVATDIMVRHYGEGKRGNKKIILITHAESPLNPPVPPYTMEEQVDAIAIKLCNEGIVLEVMLPRPPSDSTSLLQPPPPPAPPPSYTPSSHRASNEALMWRLTKTGRVEIRCSQDELSLLASVRPSLVNPVTVYRGDFELTPSMRIKIWVYKKTQKQALPKFSGYSDRGASTDEVGAPSHKVTMEREYKSTEDMDVKVAPLDRATAYRYGPHLINVSDVENKSLRFTAEKGVCLIGFTKASKVPRHYYAKDVSLFIPEPDNKAAARAVSALARALERSQTMAMVRCVFSARARVIIGALSPNIATEPHVPDSLFFNILPFSEDLREFAFASFNNRPPAQTPTDAQLRAADHLVRSMDLSGAGRRDEILAPEATPDPTLRRLCAAIHRKFEAPKAEPLLDNGSEAADSLDGGGELEAMISQIVRAPESAPAFADFRERFLLEPTQEDAAPRRHFWRDAVAGASQAGPGLPLEGAPGSESMPVDGEGEEGTAGANGGPIRLAGLSGPTAVSDVGSLHPVGDFEALLARRDGDHVARAVTGMVRVIQDLLEAAYNGSTYARALECVEALRKGCVANEEPREFNSFLRGLSEQCKGLGRRHSAFWQQIVDKGITLISSAECPDSDVGPEQARLFLEGQSATDVAESAPVPEEVDDMDALLDEAL